MRRSVNKNIAKPLQNVLSGKQRLWQVSQLSTQSDLNSQHRQDADSIENRKAEKWTSFDIPTNKQSTCDPETFKSGGQPINDIRSDIHKDFVRATLYYDREADTLHCYSGCNNAYRVISYHTSTANENEFKDKRDPSNYTESQIKNENDQNILDSKKIKSESSPNPKSLNEYDQRLRNFTDGVINKMKKGSYVNDPRFTYKPLNINDDIKATTSDKKYNNATENEYVRAILNGIPSKQVTNYSINSVSRSQNKNKLETSNKYNEYNFKKIEKKNSLQNKQLKEVRSDLSHVSLNPAQSENLNEKIDKSSEEKKTFLELCKNNSQQRFEKNLAKRLKSDHNKYTKAQYKDTYRDNLNAGRMKYKIRRLDDEFRSPSYSLRNGFEEKDILKCRNHSPDYNDQMYYSQAEPLNSYKNQSNQAGRKYLSYSPSQETYSQSKPIEMECTNRQDRSISEIKISSKEKNKANSIIKVKDVPNKSDKNNTLLKSEEKEMSNLTKNNSDETFFDKKIINKSISKKLLAENDSDLLTTDKNDVKVTLNKSNEKEKLSVNENNNLPYPQSISDSFLQVNDVKTQSTEFKSEKDSNNLKDTKYDYSKINDNMNKKASSVDKSIKINKNDLTKPKIHINKKINLENEYNSLYKTQSKYDNVGPYFKPHFNDQSHISPKVKSKSLESNKNLKLKIKDKDYQNLNPSISLNVMKRQEDSKLKDTSKATLQTNQPKISFKKVNNSNDKFKTEITRETTKDVQLKDKTEIYKTDSSHKLDIKENKVQETQNKDTDKIKTSVEDKEKSSDISFPGITPLTFCSTVGFENGKQFLVLSKDDGIDKAKTVENKVNLKSPEDSPEIKIENNEKSLKFDSLNETTKGKSLGDVKDKIKIEGGSVTDKLKTDTKNTLSTQCKQGEYKSLPEKPIKDTLSLLNAQQSQMNNEKITAMLKEHRRLLELLLEKVSARLPSHTNDVNNMLDRIHENKEAEKSSSLSSNSLISKQINENFRKIFYNSAEEKVKRLHPRKKEMSKTALNKEGESKGDDKSDATGSTPPSTDGKKYELKQRDIVPPKDTRANTYNYRPKPLKLKPFNVVTMMTSPSGKCVPKKSNDPLIDGSKLSKYNYSPLKQILSQYRVDATMQSINPTIQSKETILKTPEMKKYKSNNTEKQMNWRNFSYSAYLNVRSKNDRGKDKSREIISQINKISLINKKKQYNLKDNFKKRHLNVKNKSQVEVVNTLKKIIKNTSNKVKQVEKETKEESENTNQPADETSMKLSKGVFFDSIKREFHNSSNKHLKPKIILSNYLTNTKPAMINDKTKSKSLNNVKNKITFVTRQNISNMSFRSGLEIKPSIFNVDNSKQIIEGPSWVVSPEYSSNTDQWNTPTNYLNNSLTKIEKNNILSKTNITPSNTVEILTSLSKKMHLPKFLSTSTKPFLQKSLNVPVLASSAIPISSGMFKYKPYKKNETETKIEKKIKSNTVKTPKLYQVDKDYINEHLSTLAEPDNSSITTVSKKYKLSKIVKSNNDESHYKPKLFTIEPKTNILKSKPTTNCSAYKVYSRNYLQFSPLKSLVSIFSGSSPLQNNVNKRTADSQSEQLKEPCLPTEDKLKIISKQRSQSKISEYLNTKINLNEQINLPSFLPLKIAWLKMTSKIKNMFKFKFTNENQCCMPNFDELMVLISKNMEKNGWENSSTQKINKNINLDQLKQIRSRELLLISDKENKFKIIQNMAKNQMKFRKPPQFSDEGIKNF